MRMGSMLQIWFLRMLRGKKLTKLMKAKRSTTWKMNCLSGIKIGSLCEDKFHAKKK